MELSQSLLMVFLSVVILVEGADDPRITHPLIVGGSPTTIKEYPWQVAVLLNGGLHCGGSIISAEWVLSAAHCADGYDPSEMQLLIGTDSLDEGGQRYSVETMVTHELYSNTVYVNDICVMKPSSVMNLDGTSARAVTLPAPGAPRPPVGSALNITGWGQTGNGSFPTQLRVVEIIVQSFQQCMEFNGADEETQICAYSRGKDSCFGDSGGPLVNGDVQVGIVSYGSSNGCGTKASVYTYVTAFRDWITSKTGV